MKLTVRTAAKFMKSIETFITLYEDSILKILNDDCIYNYYSEINEFYQECISYTIEDDGTKLNSIEKPLFQLIKIRLEKYTLSLRTIEGFIDKEVLLRVLHSCDKLCHSYSGRPSSFTGINQLVMYLYEFKKWYLKLFQNFDYFNLMKVYNSFMALKQFVE